jgi:hypothetical protein
LPHFFWKSGVVDRLVLLVHEEGVSTLRTGWSNPENSGEERAERGLASIVITERAGVDARR